MGAQNRGGVRSNGDFRPISRYISEMVQDGYIVINRNSYVLYRLVLFPVTLSDPNYPKPPILDILCCLSYLCCE